MSLKKKIICEITGHSYENTDFPYLLRCRYCKKEIVNPIWITYLKRLGLLFSKDI